MTLANKITWGRLVISPFFILFLFIGGTKGKILSLLIFLIASLGDFLDGYFARKRNEVTSSGKIMDPIVDKILVYGAFVSFIQLHLIPFWMVIILVARDFLVMGLRVEAAAKKTIISASKLAKAKTVSQYVVIFFVFLVIISEGWGITLWSPEAVTFILMGVAVILSVVSAIQYGVRSQHLTVSICTKKGSRNL